MPEASHCTEAKGPTIVPYRLSFKVLQERAEEPQEVQILALGCGMGTTREVRAFPPSLPQSTGSFGMTHFCAVLLLCSSNQCEDGEEEEVGS